MRSIHPVKTRNVCTKFHGSRFNDSELKLNTIFILIIFIIFSGFAKGYHYPEFYSSNITELHFTEVYLTCIEVVVPKILLLKLSQPSL